MPNSIIWVGLVAVWIFVLVPMVANKRPRIRRTTDAALATRVLHRGGATPTPARGPASGHRSDPNWRPAEDDAEDLMENDLDHEQDEFRGDSEFVPQRRGRGGFDPEADAIARAARYSFRQRTVLASFFVLVMSAGLGVLVSPIFWWAFTVTLVGLSSYLFYLRRQVRIEEDIRRRRMTRLQRSRLGVESRSDPELNLTPERLRRPGAVVMEVDDEDPEFDHLEHYDERTSDAHLDVRMRRASGE
jgi:hypothetical protein